MTFRYISEAGGDRGGLEHVGSHHFPILVFDRVHDGNFPAVQVRDGHRIPLQFSGIDFRQGTLLPGKREGSGNLPAPKRADFSPGRTPREDKAGQDRQEEEIGTHSPEGLGAELDFRFFLFNDDFVRQDIVAEFLGTVLGRVLLNAQAPADIYGGTFLNLLQVGHLFPFPGDDIVPGGLDNAFVVAVEVGKIRREGEAGHLPSFVVFDADDPDRAAQFDFVQLFHFFLFYACNMSGPRWCAPRRVEGKVREEKWKESPF